MIDGLFRTYRPELHDMRGPGPKWHAKHGVRIGQAVFVDGRCRGAMAAPARRTIKSQDRRAKWKRAAPMLQILALVVAMLVNPATAERTETSYCGRYLAAARLRWAATLTNPLIGFSCASEPAGLEQLSRRGDRMIQRAQVHHFDGWRSGMRSRDASRDSTAAYVSVSGANSSSKL